MNNTTHLFMFLMFAATFSQILLKQSANMEHKNGIYEYLNWRVILAYAIFAAVLLLNTYAYTKVPYKYGSIIDTFTYVFVLVFSRFLLKEEISRGKLAGNLLIIFGILVYSL